MAGLIELKQELAESLADAGYKVLDYVPENVAPPVVIMGGDDPYLEEGGTFDKSEMVCNLQVYLLLAPGSNQKQVRDLDRMLAAVLPHFGDWSLTVNGPDLFTVNQSLYFGCMISASNTFDLA